MNWKDEAMDKLRNYDALRQSLSIIPEELERLEQEASALRGVDFEKPTVKSSGSRRENALINNLVQRRELAQNFQQAQRLVRNTDQALGALYPDEKLVLHRLYLYPEKGALDRLCGELGVEQSSIYRKRDKALHHFTMAYYGVSQ